MMLCACEFGHPWSKYDLHVHCPADYFSSARRFDEPVLHGRNWCLATEAMHRGYCTWLTSDGRLPSPDPYTSIREFLEDGPLAGVFDTMEPACVMAPLNVFQVDAFDDDYEPNESDAMLRALSDIVDTPPAARTDDRIAYGIHALARTDVCPGYGRSGN